MTKLDFGYSAVTPEKVAEGIDDAIVKAQAILDGMAAPRDDRTFEDTMLPLDQIGASLGVLPECEPVAHGIHAAADAVARLDDDHRGAVRLQVARGRKTRKAGASDKAQWNNKAATPRGTGHDPGFGDMKQLPNKCAERGHGLRSAPRVRCGVPS